MNANADVIIVGSGAAGAQAAQAVIDAGFSATVIDYGNDDPQTAALIADAPFEWLRRDDPNQRAYFVGDAEHLDVQEIRVGAHLTPPRQFITRDVDRLLPFESQTFEPMQSLALGGLAAGWGAGAYTFEEWELREAGLPAEEVRSQYEAVARQIGVSGAREDDIGPLAADLQNLQPPLDIDTNASSIFAAYKRKRDALFERGFRLGRAPVAALSVEGAIADDTRRANPYFDMDFYSDSRRSVYRPKYTIERLREHPRFTYVGRALVESFAEDEGGVEVRFRTSEGTASVRGRKLLLAANAINSARIALRSLDLTGVRVPILCNPYHYIPCVNLAMLGRKASDRRHSLAQLFGVYEAPHRSGERVTAALYSYRSLLIYKLVKEMPLPAALGTIAARALLTSFTIAGVHHPDRRTDRKSLWLERAGERHVLHAEYALDEMERQLVAADLREVRRFLRAIGCMPLMAIDPGYGSSIHYAGTMPSGGDAALRTQPSGRIEGTKHVYAADSSGWTYLPAKGLTLTIMANARRIASRACEQLRAPSIA